MNLISHSQGVVQSYMSYIGTVLYRYCTVLYDLADLLVPCKQPALTSADANLHKQSVAFAVAICEACKSWRFHASMVLLSFVDGGQHNTLANKHIWLVKCLEKGEKKKKTSTPLGVMMAASVPRSSPTLLCTSAEDWHVFAWHSAALH